MEQSKKIGRPKGSLNTKPNKKRECKVSSKKVGTKKGRYLILELIHDIGNIKFKVKCDCGTEKIITQSTLINSNSCGCLSREITSKRQIKPNCESAKRELFNGYLNGAKVRNINFELSFEDTFNIAANPCFYCGEKETREIKRAGGSIKVTGIDRVDNTKGYILNNCVPCCKKCNLKKSDITLDMIMRVYEFLKKP